MLCADVARCEGKRLHNGKLLGICSTCERQIAGQQRTDHPRVTWMQQQALQHPHNGTWTCPYRIES